MKYELILATDTCDSFSNYPHTREGLEKALDRVDKVRSKDGFQSARIISSRDGEVFALDMSVATN
jgi:hypothetical protein